MYSGSKYFCLMKTVTPVALLFVLITSCSNNDSVSTDTTTSAAPQTPVLSYTVVATYPHDTSSYTQGLEFYKGQLLEGTGLEGKSKLAKVDLATGKAVQNVPLDPKLFGEGITVLHDTLYQLTWQEHRVLVYSAKDFKKIKELPLNPEGWGM